MYRYTSVPYDACNPAKWLAQYNREWRSAKAMVDRIKDDLSTQKYLNLPPEVHVYEGDAVEVLFIRDRIIRKSGKGPLLNIIYRDLADFLKEYVNG